MTALFSPLLGDYRNVSPQVLLLLRHRSRCCSFCGTAAAAGAAPSAAQLQQQVLLLLQHSYCIVLLHHEDNTIQQNKIQCNAVLYSTMQYNIKCNAIYAMHYKKCSTIQLILINPYIVF